MRSPGEIVSAVPFLLGFVPEDSLVAISLRDKRLGLTSRLDLADVEPLVLELLIGALQRDGATAVILVAFGACREATAPVLEQARDALLAADLDVVDDISVIDGRWFHEGCTQARCCPPAGTPVADHDQAPSTLALSTTTGGYRADRATLAAECRPDRPLLTQAIRAELEHPALAEDVDPVTLVGDMAAILGWGASPDVTSGQIARAGLAAQHSGLRDIWYAVVAPGMMRDCPPGERELHKRLCAAGAAAGDLSPQGILLDDAARARVLTRLLTWVRNLPDDVPDVCMFPFIIAALAHWCAGDGARAALLVERASALDYPAPGMLGTLQRSIAHGVRPPELGWLAPEFACA